MENARESFDMERTTVFDESWLKFSFRSNVRKIRGETDVINLFLL